MRTHNAVLRLLRNPLWTAPERTLFFQIFTGCDFLTPFNHQRKPECYFCDQKATPQHLLFECPLAYDEYNRVAVLGSLEEATGNPLLFGKILQLIIMSDYDALFLFYMGITCPVKMKNQVTKITSSALIKIKAAWLEAAVQAAES